MCKARVSLNSVAASMHIDRDQNTHHPRESAEKATLARSEGIAACGTAEPQTRGARPRHPECFQARQPGGRPHCTPRRNVSHGMRAGWEVAAQRGVACTCDESHRSAAAWRRHCRSWRIDHRAYHRRHCGRGIQRPALLSPTARLQGYPEPANVPNLLLPNHHGARWRIVARGPVTCWLWLLLLQLYMYSYCLLYHTCMNVV